MFLLPRGVPVKEQIAAGRLDLPAVLARLQQGRFSGYLRFGQPAGSGLLLFQAGRLIGAWFESAGRQLSGSEALPRLFLSLRADPGRLDVYRLAPEMAVRLHALLQGEVLYSGQLLRQTNRRLLLEQLHARRLNACLRIYTEERVALIFYRDGEPQGFFVDGALDLETTVDLAHSVARAAEARVDVVVTGRPGEPPPDLLAAVKVAELWRQAGADLEQGRREQMLALLQTIARKHLGPAGVPLVEKEFAKLPGGLLGAAQLPGFFANLAVSALPLIDPRQTSLMLDEMSKAAHGLLKGN